MNYCCYLYYYK